MAQDLNAPQYAKWGSTLEEKQQNILNSNFLKESCDNRDYDAAARYLNALIKSCPEASSAIYQRGAIVYKNKINRAKSLAEKNAYVDSLMLMYDLRAKYFGDNPKQGTAYMHCITRSKVGSPPFVRRKASWMSRGPSSESPTRKRFSAKRAHHRSSTSVPLVWSVFSMRLPSA